MSVCTDSGSIQLDGRDRVYVDSGHVFIIGVYAKKRQNPRIAGIHTLARNPRIVQLLGLGLGYTAIYKCCTLWVRLHSQLHCINSSFADQLSSI